MDKVVKLYENEGIETNFKVIEGDAASEIIDEAEKGEYDLVIMETHSMKENKRFLLGSVTNKVVHHIKVPILVVK
jgi:nucleotide-binding universal stress UspA family protein